MEEERMEQPRRRRKPKSFFRRLLELPKKTLLTLVAILVVFVAIDGVAFRFRMFAIVDSDSPHSFESRYALQPRFCMS